MHSSFNKILIFNTILLVFGSLISCSEPERLEAGNNKIDLGTKSELDSIQEQNEVGSTFNVRDESRVDSVHREMTPKHPTLHWSSIKVLPTKATILDKNDSTIWVQYFKNGQLKIDDSKFKQGIYTIYISDTIGNILSERFITR